MIQPTPPLRRATSDDAQALAELVDFASEGLALYLWSKIAGPDGDPWAVGRERAQRETGGFSFRNAIVLEQGGRIAAGLIGYPLPDRPEPIPDSMPPMFVPLQELENLAPGTWYVNVLAAYPDKRGQGLGTALLALADKLAAEAGRSRLEHHRLRRQHRRPPALRADRLRRGRTARERSRTAGRTRARTGCCWSSARNHRSSGPWRWPPTRRSLHLMTGILDKITAYKRDEIAAAKARRPLATVEAAARAAPPVRPLRGGDPGQGRRRPVRADRRDQEGEPVQGPHPPGLRSAGAGQGLCGGRCRVPFGADRYALFPRRAGVSDAKPAPRPSCRPCARTSCSIAIKCRKRARWAPTAS